MYNSIFENLINYNYSSDKDEEIKIMLEKTWTHIAESHCMYILSERSYGEYVDKNSLVRVEVSADDVRNAVYCNMNIWENVSPDLYDYWFDMPVEKQDQLLCSVFPNNRVYGV